MEPDKDIIEGAGGEALFRALLATAVNGIIVIDEEARILVYNKACERLFGYAPDEAIGGNVDMLMPEPHHSAHNGYIERYLRTGVPGIIGIGREVVGKRKDGSTFPMYLSVGEGRLKEKRIFVGIINDPTEHRASGRRISELQEELYHHGAIVANSDDAIIRKDLSGIVTSWNMGAETMFGWGASEIIGQPIALLFPPDRIREEDDFLGRLMAGERIDHYETVRRRKDGQDIIVSVTISPIRDPDGKIIGASKIARDITAKKSAEQHLRESQRNSEELVSLLDTLLSSAPIGFAFIDLSYRFVRINDALAAINGIPAKNHIGRTVEDVVPGLWAQIEPAYRKVLNSDKAIISMEMGGRTGGGPHEDRHWLASFYPVRVRGEVIGIGIIVVEVTELRRTEAQLRQAQKMEAIGNLTGGMAHDFNNLLGVIIGNLDMVKSKLGNDPDAMELTSEALDAALRGADLTRQLLAYSRRQPLLPIQINVNELVARMVKLLGRVLGENIQISFAPGPSIDSVVADRAQLEAAITNLATNARDAMPHGGRLMIATANRYLDDDDVTQYPEYPEATPGAYVMLEISDTGAGMVPEVVGRIFEPFFTTKELGKGSGLGLSMVFGFAKQSGGHISVYSKPGKGTTFRLYLPRTTAEIADSQPTPAPAGSHGGHETVLVVEDNAAMRRVALRQLTGLGYRVLEAESAAVALQLLQQEHVDVLFTDVVMPGGMNGFELARAASERRPMLKILLTSGFPEAKLNGDDGNTSGLRLLTKPYRKEDLARTLREVLDG